MNLAYQHRKATLDSMRIRSHGSTHKGLVRKRNEDSFLNLSDIGLYAVADGIGGLPGGDVASRLTVERLTERFRKIDTTDEKAVAAAVKEVNADVNAESVRRELSPGMGSTLTFALIDKASILVGHVGDSRAFLFDGKTLSKLTVEHNVANEMRAQGVPMSASSYYGHALTRSIGQSKAPAVDLKQISPKPGQRLLLCTDGITDLIKEPELSSLVAKAKSPETLIDSLLETGLDRGAHDNMTAVAVFFD